MPNVDALLIRLVEEIERDGTFDVNAYLEQHAAAAPELRVRWQALVAAGFLDSRGSDAAGDAAWLQRLSQMVEQASNGESPLRRPIKDRYERLAPIARGGMGVVEQAFDRVLGREVAIKILDASSLLRLPASARQRILQRFMAEARITARLEHPNIVPVQDLGADPDGRIYFVMKRITGETLQERAAQIQRGAAQWPLRRRLDVLLRIGDALAFAHRRGVIHRDLKPANVMVGEFGEVLLLDWGLLGLAESVDEALTESTVDAGNTEPDLQLTLIGEVLGTPGYLAPEQAHSTGAPADARVDVFGMGGLLFFLLTGEALYAGRSATDVRKAALAGQWRQELLQHSRVPAELRAVCVKALALDPDQRYASVELLTADLRAYLEQRPGDAWHDHPLRSLDKFARRHPVWTATALGVLLTVLFAQAFFAEKRGRSVDRAKLEQVSREEALQKIELARIDQLKADQVFATELLHAGRTLEPLGRSGMTGRLPTLRRLAQALCASPYSLGEDPKNFTEQLQALRNRDPDAHQRALTSLDLLCLGLVESRVAAASWGLDEAVASSEKELEAIRSRRQDSEDLVDLWPDVEAAQTALSSNGWRMRLWDAVFELGHYHPFVLQALADESLAERSARELELLGLAARLLPTGDRSLPRREGRIFEEALQRDQELYWAGLYLGIELQKDAQHLAAILAWSKARVVDPESPGLLINIATALCSMKQFSLALPWGDKAIRSAPKEAGAHSIRGLALQALGRSEEALISFEQALECDPEAFYPQLHRAGLLAEQGALEKAEAIYRRLVNRHPRRIDGTIRLAELLAFTGRALEGARCYAKLRDELGPGRAELWTESAMMLERSGHFVRALYQWEQFAAIPPTGDQSRHWDLPSRLRELPRVILAQHGFLDDASDRERLRAARGAAALGFPLRAAELYQQISRLDQGGPDWSALGMQSDALACSAMLWDAIAAYAAASSSEGLEFQAGWASLETGETIPEGLDAVARQAVGWQIREGEPAALQVSIADEDRLLGAALSFCELWVTLRSDSTAEGSAQGSLSPEQSEILSDLLERAEDLEIPDGQSPDHLSSDQKGSRLERLRSALLKERPR